MNYYQIVFMIDGLNKENNIDIALLVFQSKFAPKKILFDILLKGNQSYLWNKQKNYI